MARNLLLCLLCLIALCSAVHAEEPAPEVKPYPGLLVALPMDSGITARWACPPVEKEKVDKAYLYDLRLGIDTDGAPWLGYKGKGFLCPTKSLICETSCSYENFVFLDNGAMLLATASDWGYLVPPKAGTPKGKRPPVITYQPVAALPVPGAQMYAGRDCLFFAGKNPATGKHDVYLLTTGAGKNGPAGPIKYVQVFTSDEPVTAVAGDPGRLFVAVGDAILTVAPYEKTVLNAERVVGSVQALACEGDVLFYATGEKVGAYTDHGLLDLLRAPGPQIAARGGTLYVALSDTLGVLALDHAGNLAKYDLNAQAVPTDTTSTVMLTGVRCFEGGEEAPAMDDRTYADTFERAKGRYLYVQAELDNLRLDRPHTEKVKIVASWDNGGLYYHDEVTFTFEKDAPGMWGWVRFGTADYPPYPAVYTITTYLNGAKANTRTVTVSGTVSAAEAATFFDPAGLEAALKRGESANMVDEGTPLLLKAASGYQWSGSTPEERRRRTTEVVRLLLKYGADARVRDENGETALHKAAYVSRDNAEVIALLLKAGADVNARNHDGETPLHKAMLFGNLNNVRALLVKGVDVNIQDNDGQTPLYKAAFDGHAAVVDALLARKANPMLPDKNGDTALFQAVTKPELLQVMLKAGADPNATATIFGTKHSLLGLVLSDWQFTPEGSGQSASLRQSAALLRARGADLLPGEDRAVFRNRGYQLLDEALLMRIFARDTEKAWDGVTPALLSDTESLDDPAVQRAAIRFLLSRSRTQIAGATSVVQYQQALITCNAARRRMEKFLRPDTTWLPEVLYNCAMLEAYLGDFTRAKEDLQRYLNFNPKDAKAVQALLKQYSGQEAALREPVVPEALAGTWWPDGAAPDREKFFRLEFAVQNGQLSARVLPQAGRENLYRASTWVPVTITGNRLEFSGAVFYNNAADDGNPYSNTVTLTRIGENRLLGEIRFSGEKIENGTRSPNNGTGTFEWRRRK